MKAGIFCAKCGTNNGARAFRCSRCRAFVRPVYPTMLGIGALLVIYGLWLQFMSTVVPGFASLLSSHGAKFSLLVRVSIEVGHHFTGWGALLGLAFFGVLIWLGLFWKPQRAYGRNLVMTVVLVKATGALAVVLLAALDVLPFLTKQ